MTADVLDLTVEALGAAGDGIARTADGPVFVPGALPGERLCARLVGRRGEGRLALPDAWLSESADRVVPPCPHFGACGGCTLQHLAAAPLADWKRVRLAEALRRAGFADPAVAPMAGVPPGSRRRADLALRRTPGGVTVGLHAPGSTAVVDLATCLVLVPRLVALLAPLRTLLRGLPALRREGSAVINVLDDGPDLLLRTDAALDAAGRARLAEFARAHSLPRIAWALRDAAPEVAAQLGPARLRFGDAVVAPPPGAFLQPSVAGEAAIRAAVLACLPEPLPPRAAIAELYAGLGTLSFALAQRARVLAFEGDAAAVAALAAAAGREGARVQATRRDLTWQPLTSAELRRCAVVVLDPPFGGAAVQMGAIAAARVARVAYVSCNPAALERDAAVLARAGYRLDRAVPIDQFPWSSQLEAVAGFSL